MATIAIQTATKASATTTTICAGAAATNPNNTSNIATTSMDC